MLLTVLEAKKLKIKESADSVHGEDISWFVDDTFLLCLHMAKGTKYLSWAFFVRTLIPFMRVLPA